MDRKQPMKIQSLMSPEEPALLDTFALQRTGESSEISMESFALNRALPMSPPVSPDVVMLKPDEAPVETARDPILYAEPRQSPIVDSATSITSPSPNASELDINDHIAKRDRALFRKASPPQLADYALTVSFRSQFLETFKADPRGWYRREKAQLLKDRELSKFTKRFVSIAPANTIRHPRPTASNQNNSNSKIIKSPNRGPRPAPEKPAADPNKGKNSREDKEYDSVPDYCPPLSSLPNKQNSLKVDWKGAILPLNEDPDRHLLHPDEIQLAATLRLDCATYLTSKRRIFVRRLECLRIKKEFRKTDSQQACKIDVNKASKLWMAFDKVGWLHEDWVRMYLDDTESS
ncbi:putative SWIRM domain-containing protein [Calycina marina]|uniref:SWIRM domain-containing protein n=1 Tax=Calycina marina TaxID=1763456 RepID=A0A9P7Z255_9HELO|nr:putative SWIRM domain-containing protein [Calycina marina]